MKRIAEKTLAGAVVGAVAVSVFWLTAFPSITWWDSSSYSLAAATFGVSSSPGSLLLMLIGWPIAQLPFGGSPAYRLNLFAGVLAGVAALFVYTSALVALRSDRVRAIDTDSSESTGMKLGAGIGALTFAFASTTWEHAVMYTPYILTAVFTGALLFTLLRWWHRADAHDAWKQLALLGLLFGLDFSVHRTNALLIPGALAFVLIRSPRTIIQPKNMLASAGGLVAGLSLQLLLIPIARVTNSELNFGNPRDLTRFLDYVSLSQSGGSFFVKIFPRNASVWSVQIADFLRALGDNVLHWNGASGVAGFLPAIAAVLGVYAIAMRRGKLAIALLVLLSLQASMTIICFNIPADYFRSLDRHCLPVFATVGVLVACGLATMAHWITMMLRKRKTFTLVLVVLLLLVPGAQLLDNWHTHNASRQYFARDYAMNALSALPPNAIYFTVGDNDTFPLMYLQGADGVRPDVQIVNMSVMQYDDYPDQRHAHTPTLPLSILSAERRGIVTRPWADTLVVIPFEGDNAHFGLSAETQTLSEATFTVKPTMGEKMTPGEVTLLDIVRTNRWRRPITFAITATKSGMSWLAPYAPMEGMYWRIVPLQNPSANVDAIRRNLFSAYSYRGYADSTVIMDDVAARLGALYYEPLSELIAAARARSDTASCRADVARMMTAIPPGRLAVRSVMERPDVPKCE